MLISIELSPVYVVLTEESLTYSGSKLLEFILGLKGGTRFFLKALSQSMLLHQG